MFLKYAKKNCKNSAAYGTLNKKVGKIASQFPEHP